LAEVLPNANVSSQLPDWGWLAATSECTAKANTPLSNMGSHIWVKTYKYGQPYLGQDIQIWAAIFGSRYTILSVILHRTAKIEVH